METTNKIFNLRQRTYQYALDVVKFLEGLPRGYIPETIGKQLLRSATSVGANVIEARGSSSKKDFANFYRHALKSANESVFWLDLLRDSGSGSDDRLGALRGEVDQLSKILASSILTMQGRRRG